MSRQLVTINLVIYNGEKYICRCLDSILSQSYPDELLEINILDNDSSDLTAQKINDWGSEVGLRKFKFNFIRSKSNLGMWPGQELLLEHSRGEFIIVLSVDVILHPDFVKNAIVVMENDLKIGALQAKIYKYELPSDAPHSTPYTINSKVVDTLGFQIFRSRRIVNIGHGETDSGQFDRQREVFAVEGAVPVFRKEALEDCRLNSQNKKIVEPDFFWYGDDLDLAWRMRIFGWKQVYSPGVIAWHDRKTTKSLAGGWREFIKIRRSVPIFKRRLDWRNTTLTIIKNDFASNLLKDSLAIFWRQVRLWVYFLIFEPTMFLEISRVARMLPNMLERRREIMKKSRISSQEFRKWIN